MNETSIGSLEETILLIVLVMQEDVYGVSVVEEYQSRTGKTISIPAIHTVLKRLEQKGLVTSKMGGATTERGGRKKRIFEITKAGYKILADLKATRDDLWEMAPQFKTI
ncbi:MAG: helix-turn-helix transcriptional regulator [Marinoscillum sp.]|uniref:PadR family transcriptional regulator n=1 Tax=Marinoscillum sp. TaxID=2024838 RepID=UPI0032F88FE1